MESINPQGKLRLRGRQRVGRRAAPVTSMPVSRLAAPAAADGAADGVGAKGRPKRHSTGPRKHSSSPPPAKHPRSTAAPCTAVVAAGVDTVAPRARKRQKIAVPVYPLTSLYRAFFKASTTRKGFCR